MFYDFTRTTINNVTVPLWLVIVRGVALSSMTVEDGEAYKDLGRFKPALHSNRRVPLPAWLGRFSV
jgi:hypothetical protein